MSVHWTYLPAVIFALCVSEWVRQEGGSPACIAASIAPTPIQIDPRARALSLRKAGGSFPGGISRPTDAARMFVTSFPVANRSGTDIVGALPFPSFPFTPLSCELLNGAEEDRKVIRGAEQTMRETSKLR